MYKQRQEGGYKEEEEEDGDMIEATSNHMVTGTPLNKKKHPEVGFFLSDKYNEFTGRYNIGMCLLA